MKKVTLLLVFLAFACSRATAPVQAPHFYTTSTQQQSPKLTGVHFIYFHGNILKKSERAMSKLLVYTPQSLQIDGREVWSQNLQKDYSNFIQLPPGQHHFVFQWEYSNLGYGDALTTHEVIFEIESGQMGRIECWSGYIHGDEYMCGENAPKGTGGVRKMNCGDPKKTASWKTCKVYKETFKSVEKDDTDRDDDADKAYDKVNSILKEFR
jgi:hypothetical protein